MAMGMLVVWTSLPGQKRASGNADFWISYSFLDTKRRFLDYPIETQPTFAADSNVLSVVYKAVCQQDQDPVRCYISLHQRMAGV